MVVNKVNYKSKNKDDGPIKFELDIMSLDVLCKYVLQSPSLLRMEHLVNLRKMVNMVHPSIYENDPEKVKRMEFIFKALEARLDHNINDQNMILVYINNNTTFDLDFIDRDQINLSRDEISFGHQFVEGGIKYQFIYGELDHMIDICTRFKTTDFQHKGEIAEELEDLVDNMKNGFRRIHINDNAIDMNFSLRDGVFEGAVTDTWNMITNPSRRLMTGMQGLNEMVGGGLECGRVYMLMGTSGVGKSITLLNLIYQIKKYNTHFQTKDPTKTPCIVLLTMENTVVETITRLFDLVVPDSHGMGNYEVQEVIRMLREEGKLVVNDESPIDIVIRYKANKSVNTSYLYTLCDDLDDEGYEVICLVQDHVKRIRSIYPNSDLRLELGDVVNEFKVFAAEKDIPVISNTHLNRDAARIIEDAARKANQDTGKLLGKSNIGESMLMIDNLDCGIIITLDFDKEENRYMTFNLIKMRDKTERTYIAQPFDQGSTIRLMEDVGGIPQFKESIHTAPEFNNRPNTIIKMTGASSMMNNMDNELEQFKNATMYNLNQPQQEPNNGVYQPIEFVNDTSDDMHDEIMNLAFKKDDGIGPMARIVTEAIYFGEETEETKRAFGDID